MQPILSIALIIYLLFYVFEGVIRYGFNLLGADSLIFIRDAVLVIPLLMVLAQQFFQHRLHPAFWIYTGIIALHGAVMVLNIGSVMAVIYSAKMLITVLVGAIAAETLMRPSRKLLAVVLVVWAVSWVAVLVDKYFMEMPWMGLTTQIGDVEVEVSRDWQVEGADKRAAGLMRSSINAATVMPLLALMLVFHVKSLWLRVPIALLTVPLLVWTTQKGPIIGYMLTLGAIMVWPRRSMIPLKACVLLSMALTVTLPVVLLGSILPSGNGGVFSFSSFYMRIEEMWPHAWRWIDDHELFPFGVGLGGISGAQRLYALHDMNAADNLFVLLYAFFGVFSFVYLGFIAFVVLLVRNGAGASAVQAMATLAFLFGYAIVISLLEDQMASLFLGASVTWLCRELKSQRPQPSPLSSVAAVP